MGVRRITLAFWLVVTFFLISACVPAAPPGSPEHAIEEAFGHLGPQVVQEAKDVAWCESRMDPHVVNGQYRGLFQLGYNYNGTIEFYGGSVDAWSDPYVNAQAARDGYAAYGDWRQWECKP